jgi:hypothetical protein
MTREELMTFLLAFLLERPKEPNPLEQAVADLKYVRHAVDLLGQRTQENMRAIMRKLEDEAATMAALSVAHDPKAAKA